MTTRQPANPDDRGANSEHGGRRVEYLPLDAILPATRNPRRHDLDGVRASIARFGFTAPALRDERTGRLVAGHGRLEALKAMQRDGESPPPGVRLYEQAPGLAGWLVPVVCGWSSRDDLEAEAYLVADNEWTLRGSWDTVGLLDILTDVSAADAELLGAAGFDSSDLDDLLASIEDPFIHDAVPGTEAGWAETEEEMAARRASIDAYEPRRASVPGFTEMILVYRLEDREEVGRLINAIRAGLGAELRGAEVVLMALRAFAASASVTEPQQEGEG